MGYFAGMIAYILGALFMMIVGIGAILGLVVLIDEMGWFTIPALAAGAMVGFWALIRINRETAP